MCSVLFMSLFFLFTHKEVQQIHLDFQGVTIRFVLLDTSTLNTPAISCWIPLTPGTKTTTKYHSESWRAFKNFSLPIPKRVKYEGEIAKLDYITQTHHINLRVRICPPLNTRDEHKPGKWWFVVVRGLLLLINHIFSLSFQWNEQFHGSHK